MSKIYQASISYDDLEVYKEIPGADLSKVIMKKDFAVVCMSAVEARIALINIDRFSETPHEKFTQGDIGSLYLNLDYILTQYYRDEGIE